MAKKAQKPVTNTNSGPPKWELGLLQAQLQEDNWKVCIALLIENKLEDAANVNYLHTAIAIGSRRLFDRVTRQNLYREVYLYGNPKNRPKEIPLYTEVCEVCKVYLDNKEEIPDVLLAKLIKYKLLAIKADDIKRRQVIKDPEVGKGKAAKAPKSAGKKGGGGKKTEETTSAKQGTLLKKRSEENLDQKFIDDEPDDGPQHYIIISGFYHTKLLLQLGELDVHINTVIRYGCSDYNRFLNLQPEKDESLPKDSRLIAAEEAAAAENIRIKTGTETFWKEIFPLLMSQPADSPLYHTHVQDQWINEPMPQSDKPEVQAAYCQSMFDDIAHLLYDLVDSRRQYENYIRNMKVITVPEIGEVISKSSPSGPSETPIHPTGSAIMDMHTLETTVTVDTRYYNDLIDTIPLESVTIPIIIHCLIEQIVATEEQIEPPSEKIHPPTSDGLHQEVASHLGEMIQKISMDEECLSSVVNMLPEQKVFTKEKQPMLSEHDTITKKFHHLLPFHGFDPEEVETKMQQKYSPYGVELFPEVSASDKKTLAARTQEFLYFCSKEGLPIAFVDRVLSQNVLECMSLASVGADGTFEYGPPNSVIAWDYPYILLEQKQLLTPTIVQPKTSPEDAFALSSQESWYSNFNEIRRFMTSSCSDTRPEIDNFGEIYNNRNTEEEEEKPCPTKVMDDILIPRKRNLENWNFIEHFEPNIFLQVLHKASYTLPYWEKYYHHRDNCLYIVFYNPYNIERWNKESWNIQLHSNVGFRNYMLHVASNIQEWTQEEEKKYEAFLDLMHAQRLKELERAMADAALAEQLAEKVSNSNDKKTPTKKAPPATNKSPTRHDTIFPSNGEFIRQGSLKALKHEDDLMKEEEEKKKDQKSPKKVEKAEKENKPSPVMSAKSNRVTKVVKEDSCMEITPTTEVLDEKELPFTGYDMGNSIISLTANKYTLFPNDGAQMRVETAAFLYGYQSVRCSVLKNGHVISVHLLNPKDVEETEPAPEPKIDASLNENVAPVSFAGEEEEKGNRTTTDSERFSAEESIYKMPNPFSDIVYSDFGSITAVLSDGMTLSFSKFGPTGYHSSVSEKKTVVSESPKPETSSLPSSRETPTSQRKKSKIKISDSSDTSKVSDEIKEFDLEVKDSPLIGPPTPSQQPAFQNLYLTCPDGLKIEYFLECSYGIEPMVSDQQRLLVKQSYPFRSHGIQSCESTRNKHAYHEQYRIIISDGTVIKKMKNGTFEVLYVDGTVAKLEFISSDKGALDDHSSLSSCITGGKKSAFSEKVPYPTVIEPDIKNLNRDKWTITHPSGQKFILTPDGKRVELPRVLFSMKSDIKSGQTVLTRDDHVILVSETTGKTIVEHEDGTRITSYYEEIASAAVIRESNKEIQDEPLKKMFIMVECPSFATLKFDRKTSENLTLLANGMLVNVFPDGYYSLLLAGEHAGDRLYLDLDGTLTYTSPVVDYVTAEADQPETVYTFKHNAKTICETVDPDGIIFRVDHKGQPTVITDFSSNNPKEKSISVEDAQITEYKTHVPRIFFLHPDGSGGELLTSEKVDNYLNWFEQDPANIILKDMFQDQPGIYGITLLKPHNSFPQSWLKDYELDSIIPESILLQTSIKPEPVKSQSVVCPDILETRQFTQYPLVNETWKKGIQQGLCDYIEYCFDRCKGITDAQIVDKRSEKEKKLAETLQENVKQFDLKKQLRPLLEINEVKRMYEEVATSNQIGPIVEEKQKESQNVPNVEKIKKDQFEEEMAKKALRSQEIPKYFDSMFGKAFLETEEIKVLDEKLGKLSDFPVFPTEPVDCDSNDSKTGPVTEQRDITPLSGETFDGVYSSETEPAFENSSELRPVNPSPTHAIGNGSPNAVRPKNPTPNLQKTEPIQERPENPTAKDLDSVLSEIKNPSEELTKYSPDPAAEPLSTLNYTGASKNLLIDVTGQPRSTAVPMPKSLVGGRVNAITNHKIIEEPVRRQIHNSITAGSAPESQWRLKMMRGLNLYPEEINFGVLREGNSYMMCVYLINTGVDSCHFKIKNPPPATGLQVSYHPGAVAAGLKRKLTLELFAIAVGAEEDIGVGAIHHNLCITTETHILQLPIHATVLTAFEYDRQKEENELDPNGSSAELISTVPLGTQGIIRPKRKISKGLPCM